MSLEMLEKLNSPRVFHVLSEPSWERQERESKTAWNYFCAYRDQTQRSYSILARAVDRSKTRITAVARKWQWQKRIVDFDRYQDEVRRLELASARVAANRESLALISATKKIIADRLSHIESSSFSARDLLYGLRILIQTEALLLGLPTSRTEVIESAEQRHELIVLAARAALTEGLRLFPRVAPEKLRLLIAKTHNLDVSDLIEASGDTGDSRLGMTG